MVAVKQPGTPTQPICVGVIVGPHGVRGAVRVQSFTSDPAAITAYQPLFDESGSRRFALKKLAAARGGLVAAIRGVEDRDAAAALAGTRLFTSRDALPKLAEEEYYQADLIGLRAESSDGGFLGTVKAVHNHGGGPYLEIAGETSEMMIPFGRRTVPVVDLGGGRVVVDPPTETDDDPDIEQGGLRPPLPASGRSVDRD